MSGADDLERYRKQFELLAQEQADKQQQADQSELFQQVASEASAAGVNVEDECEKAREYYRFLKKEGFGRPLVEKDVRSESGYVIRCLKKATADALKRKA